MSRLNAEFKKLKREYIFPVIEQKLREVREQYPAAEIVNLGVGDIALPLAPSVARAICEATQEMTTSAGMRGYGPSEGYLFLREKICETSYPAVGITPDEVFVSEGTNADTTQVLELFPISTKIGIPTPTYPAYLDSAIIGGRSSHISLLPCLAQNQFLPLPPTHHLDFIYLCSPNNPTGTALNRKQIADWIAYAHRENALLLIDNAYEAFVRSPDVPRSVYEIEGAKEVAIECRSFSKSAGFTALRCAYTVIPKSIQKGELHRLWWKRQSIKSNGVSYPIQRGAWAALSTPGMIETQLQITHYQQQGTILSNGLTRMGASYVGGIDAPYLWWKIPDGKTSWEYFEELLRRYHLITIPGNGFGLHGEGYLRLSTFTTQASVAIERLCNLLS